jgi:hypothetical protein
VLRPGEIVTLGFVQDRDRDGLIARQEFFFGSSDRRQDTDGDQLDDFAEVKAGWEIQVAGSPIRRVFSDPRSSDSDFDGLSDYEEQDIRRVQCECVSDTDSTFRSGPCTPRLDGQPACPGGESCLNVADKDQAAGALIACSTEVVAQRTDPRSRDTDADLVSDAGEVLEFLTGAAIIDPREVILASTNRVAETVACPDDVCTGRGN